ncbi:MAG: hypothetical protein H7832_13630 [Magnetococcus sp. DMHC-6]
MYPFKRPLLWLGSGLMFLSSCLPAPNSANPLQEKKTWMAQTAELEPIARFGTIDFSTTCQQAIQTAQAQCQHSNIEFEMDNKTIACNCNEKENRTGASPWQIIYACTIYYRC